MKPKNTKMKALPILAALALVAFLPTASADHGYHECTEEDPCDNRGNQGCDGATLAVDCTYESHGGCYSSINEEGQQAMYCRHDSKNCLISVDNYCQMHGSIDYRTA